MQGKRKLLLRSILTSVLILSSCTTISVPTVDPLRIREVSLPEKLSLSPGDEKQVSVSLYELKNAVMYKEFLDALILKHNKDAAMVNENGSRVEKALFSLQPQVLRLQRERDFAYGVAGVTFLSTLFFSIGALYAK